MSIDKLRRNRYELMPQVEARIVEFIKRFPREYVYCGEIAVFAKSNLEWTIWAMEEMTIRGVICKMSNEDKKKNDIDVRACVFTLPTTK